MVIRGKVVMPLIAFAALAILLASSANADLTPVYDAVGSEMGHMEILNGIYGSGFHLVSGSAVDYTNDLITATRVADFFQPTPGDNIGIVDGPVGNDADQVWDQGVTDVTATAVFLQAGYRQEFGYFDGASGGTYQKLFDATGYGTAVAGSASANMLGDTWRWSRSGDGQTWSSMSSDNSGQDHMVTYRISGMDGSDAVWLLFWEDLAGLGDKDYNDLVIEVNAAAPVAHAPVPTAVLLGMIGLASVAWVKKRYAL